MNRRGPSNGRRRGVALPERVSKVSWETLSEYQGSGQGGQARGSKHVSARKAKSPAEAGRKRLPPVYTIWVLSAFAGQGSPRPGPPIYIGSVHVEILNCCARSRTCYARRRGRASGGAGARVSHLRTVSTNNCGSATYAGHPVFLSGILPLMKLGWSRMSKGGSLARQARDRKKEDPARTWGSPFTYCEPEFRWKRSLDWENSSTPDLKGAADR